MIFCLHTRRTELDPLWKDRIIPIPLKLKLVKTLHGMAHHLLWSKGWTLKQSDESRIAAAEMCSGAGARNRLEGAETNASIHTSTTAKDVTGTLNACPQTQIIIFQPSL